MKGINIFGVIILFVFVLGMNISMTVLEKEDSGSLGLFREEMNDIQLQIYNNAIDDIEEVEGSTEGIISPVANGCIAASFEVIDMGVQKGEELHNKGSWINSSVALFFLKFLGWIVIPWIFIGRYFLPLVIGVAAFLFMCAKYTIQFILLFVELFWYKIIKGDK